MAKRAVEKAAREEGVEPVTPEIVLKTREKYFSLVGKDKEGEKKVTRIAVVRCHTVAEVCPGVGCLKAFSHRKLNFEEYGPDTELIGFFTCGGCSGRRVSRLVEKLLDHGLDMVHLSSCMCMNDDDYPRCPFKNQIKKAVEAKGVKVVEGTHH
jgi:predicted metal-binding protein